MLSRWTAQEIEILAEAYYSGKRIKVIAQEMKRSSTAVNKAISRRLKNRHRKQTKNNRTPALNGGQSQSVVTPNTSNQAKIVTFLTVIRYIESRGYSVSKISNSNYKFFSCDDEVFIVGKEPMTKMKMLLMANRLRIEDKEPIFVANEIIWN